MKKTKIVTLVLGLLVITSLTRCKTAQEKALSPQLDSYFEQLADNPEFSVIITKKDSVIYMGNFGCTHTTIFDIASVTKQFTGMAIALLEEKGLIDLDDKIIEYLPDLPRVMNDITINQLVHHTSGIRDWPTLFALKGWQPQEALTLDDIYETLKKQEQLNFTPGSEFLYSNSNYNLLAKIVEVVTDTSFERWSHDNLFVPLGMENTYYGDSTANRLNAPGSSSLMSSTDDMSKWLINFYSQPLGGDNLYKRIIQKGSLNDNQTIDYGYGLYLREIRNKKAYYHDGAWGGYMSATVFFPEDNIGVVLLSNNGSLHPPTIINDIANIMFGDQTEVKPKESKSEEQEINDDFFALCAGKYQQVDDKDCYLTFFKDGDGYFLNMYNKNFKLYAKSDSVYFVKEAKAEFVFHLRNGEVNSHSLEQNGNSYLALRVEEEKKEAGINYNKLTGNFYSSELDVNYQVRYDNEVLLIHSTAFPEDIILKHAEDLTFNSNSSLMQSIAFLEESGAITSLIINNPRAKNITFKKK
ncbi:MAG: beta-lactamase family protein [Synergistaceae bacterium]|nr:beta-lactamase family protein [Synergistaceae bacterium]